MAIAENIENFLVAVFDALENGSEELEDIAGEALLDTYDPEECLPEIQYRSFEQAGVLTTDRGLVVKFGTDEFQITIIQSR